MIWENHEFSGCALIGSLPYLENQFSIKMFFSDLSGGNTSTLEGWSLDITPVPEPVNVAMAVFGAGFFGIGLLRAYRGSRKTASRS